MNCIKQLFDFQELEKKELSLQDQLKSLPQAIKLRELKREIETEQNFLKQGKEALDAERRIIRNLETEVLEKNKELESLSAKLFSGEITNLKELASVDGKKKALEEEIKSLEDIILSRMETSENDKARLSDRNNILKDKKLNFKKILEEYSAAQEDLNQLIEDIPPVKDKLHSQIDKEIMTEYNDKKLKYGNNFVVELNNQTCKGCHMSVSFDVIKQIKFMGFSRCDKCGRILILK